MFKSLNVNRRHSHWRHHHFERIIFWWIQAVEHRAVAVAYLNRLRLFQLDAISAVQLRQFSINARFPIKIRIFSDPVAADHHHERKFPTWFAFEIHSLANQHHRYHHHRYVFKQLLFPIFSIRSNSIRIQFMERLINFVTYLLAIDSQSKLVISWLHMNGSCPFQAISIM